MRMRDMIADMEKSMDVLDVHKSKAKTSITRICTMVSVCSKPLGPKPEIQHN